MESAIIGPSAAVARTGHAAFLEATHTRALAPGETLEITYRAGRPWAVRRVGRPRLALAIVRARIALID